MTIDKTKIRNAATVIVLRDRHVTPHILMGQRGAKAAFMPNKFVFPGGAVDTSDDAAAYDEKRSPNERPRYTLAAHAPTCGVCGSRSAAHASTPDAFTAGEATSASICSARKRCQLSRHFRKSSAVRVRK